MEGGAGGGLNGGERLEQAADPVGMVAGSGEVDLEPVVKILIKVLQEVAAGFQDVGLPLGVEFRLEGEGGGDFFLTAAELNIGYSPRFAARDHRCKSWRPGGICHLNG